jgi:U3 small nucleolar RNA-associated protein 5
MGKKAFKGNRDTSANASANAGIILSAFEDTPTADHFALITHAVDRHRLRIFNVRSGTVSNDYSAEEKERFTCLTWGHIKDTGDIQVIGTSIHVKKKGED